MELPVQQTVFRVYEPAARPGGHESLRPAACFQGLGTTDVDSGKYDPLSSLIENLIENLIEKLIEKPIFAGFI